MVGGSGRGAAAVVVVPPGVRAGGGRPKVGSGGGAGVPVGLIGAYPGGMTGQPDLMNAGSKVVKFHDWPPFR